MVKSIDPSLKHLLTLPLHVMLKLIQADHTCFDFSPSCVDVPICKHAETLYHIRNSIFHFNFLVLLQPKTKKEQYPLKRSYKSYTSWASCYIATKIKIMDREHCLISQAKIIKTLQIVIIWESRHDSSTLSKSLSNHPLWSDSRQNFGYILIIPCRTTENI